MGAAVAEPPVATAVTPPPIGRPVSPVEYVKGLSLADKHAVFLALLDEAMRLSDGQELLRVDTVEGVTLGYYLTRQQYKQMRRLPPETDESLARLGQALVDIDDTFSITGFEAECRREDAARGR